MSEHLTTGATEDMDFEEYQSRRKALKQKSRQWGLGVFWGTGGQVKKYRARIEELDKLYEGKDYEEWKLHGDFKVPPAFGYRAQYLSEMFLVFLLFGWWTLGFANLWWHRRFNRKYPKDRRI